MHSATTIFAPELFIPNGVFDISFYVKAFGAVELRKFMNDDGSYHVSELSFNGNLFHLHEETARTKKFCPASVNGTTVIIGLFTDDVDAMMKSAIAAGAEVLSPAKDYEYGYRQGQVKDPFGHCWQIQSKI